MAEMASMYVFQHGNAYDVASFSCLLCRDISRILDKLPPPSANFRFCRGAGGDPTFDAEYCQTATWSRIFLWALAFFSVLSQWRSYNNGK